MNRRLYGENDQIQLDSKCLEADREGDEIDDANSQQAENKFRI